MAPSCLLITPRPSIRSIWLRKMRRSSNRLRKRFQQFTAEVVTHTLLEFACGQEPSGLDNHALAMHPLWLDPVEPGTLGRQPTRNDAHPCFASRGFLQYRLIVLTQPDLDLFTHMPGGIIPNEHLHLLALRQDPLAQPLQKVSHHLADWAARHKAQMYVTTGPRLRNEILALPPNVSMKVASVWSSSAPG